MVARRNRNNEKRISIEGDRCVYCGEFADSIEHWPPHSLTKSGFLLPACLECNFIAHVVFPLDFHKRAEYVKKKLKHKYRGVLSMPQWKFDELNEVNGELRGYLELCRKQKLRNERRIAWSAIQYIESIDRSKSFAPLIVVLNSIETKREKNYEFSGFKASNSLISEKNKFGLSERTLKRIEKVFAANPSGQGL